MSPAEEHGIAARKWAQERLSVLAQRIIDAGLADVVGEYMSIKRNHDTMFSRHFDEARTENK
jgi:hypothetical protein